MSEQKTDQLAQLRVLTLKDAQNAPEIKRPHKDLVGALTALRAAYDQQYEGLILPENLRLEEDRAQNLIQDLLATTQRLDQGIAQMQRENVVIPRSNYRSSERIKSRSSQLLTGEPASSRQVQELRPVEVKQEGERNAQALEMNAVTQNQVKGEDPEATLVDGKAEVPSPTEQESESFGLFGKRDQQVTPAALMSVFPKREAIDRSEIIPRELLPDGSNFLYVLKSVIGDLKKDGVYNAELQLINDIDKNIRAIFLSRVDLQDDTSLPLEVSGFVPDTVLAGTNYGGAEAKVNRIRDYLNNHKLLKGKINILTKAAFVNEDQDKLNHIGVPGHRIEISFRVEEQVQVAAGGS